MVLYHLWPVQGFHQCLCLTDIKWPACKPENGLFPGQRSSGFPALCKPCPETKRETVKKPAVTVFSGTVSCVALHASEQTGRMSERPQPENISIKKKEQEKYTWKRRFAQLTKMSFVCLLTVMNVLRQNHWGEKVAVQIPLK